MSISLVLLAFPPCTWQHEGEKEPILKKFKKKKKEILIDDRIPSAAPFATCQREMKSKSNGRMEGWKWQSYKEEKPADEVIGEEDQAGKRGWEMRTKWKGMLERKGEVREIWERKTSQQRYMKRRAAGKRKIIQKTEMREWENERWKVEERDME